MATVTLDAETPGAGAVRPVFAQSPRPLKMVTGRFSFDNSYPTGGELLTDLKKHFAGSTILGMIVEQPIIAGAQTGKFVKFNRTTQALQLFTNAAPFAEVANASDQSAITNLVFVAWGYAGKK